VLSKKLFQHHPDVFVNPSNGNLNICVLDDGVPYGVSDWVGNRLRCNATEIADLMLPVMRRAITSRPSCVIFDQYALAGKRFATFKKAKSIVFISGGGVDRYSVFVQGDNVLLMSRGFASTLSLFVYSTVGPMAKVA
jgi:hypothetical protein